MKTFKNLIVAVLFLTTALFGSAAVSFADEHSPAEIRTLKGAATALQASNPDLADQLSKYADKEAGEKEEAEENETASIKLLQDSAAALKPSNPQLADTLTKYAGKEAEEEEEEK